MDYDEMVPFSHRELLNYPLSTLIQDRMRLANNEYDTGPMFHEEEWEWDHIMDVLSRVSKGVLWLDEHRPDWMTRIDRDHLDLESGHRCVLGQLARSLAEVPAWHGERMHDPQYLSVVKRQAPLIGPDGTETYGINQCVLNLLMLPSPLTDEEACAMGFNLPDGDEWTSYGMLDVVWQTVLDVRGAEGRRVVRE